MGLRSRIGLGVVVAAIVVAFAVRANRRAEEPSGLTLRVVSYNTWLLPLGAKDLEDRKARLPEALGSFEPDVVCLQEVWLPKDQTDLATALAPTLPHAAKGRGGLLVLSRFPITEERFVPFAKDERLPVVERLAGKGVFVVGLDTPEGPVVVANTHLVLPMEVELRPVHAAQFDVVMGVVEDETRHPLVLAGDFNMYAARDGQRSEPYVRVLDLGFLPSRPARERPDGSYETRHPTRLGYPPPETPTRGWDPDFVFIRAGSGIDVEVLGGSVELETPATALSDHSLLVATFRLTRP